MIIMKVILGKKLSMSQKFADDGRVVPVTVVLAGPCVVTQVKTLETDGYQAVQVAFGEKKTISKPLAGHLKELGKFAFIREFPLKAGQDAAVKRGDTISAENFTKGDVVQVTGISKGKGFQGVVKRHHFHGSPKTHGHKDQLRMGGSIGAGGPQHVFKGRRMPGHMGTDQVTVKNLEIVDVDAANNLLYIKGALPGAHNSLVEIAAA